MADPTPDIQKPVQNEAALEEPVTRREAEGKTSFSKGMRGEGRGVSKKQKLAPHPASLTPNKLLGDKGASDSFSLLFWWRFDFAECFEFRDDVGHHFFSFVDVGQFPAFEHDGNKNFVFAA